MNVLDPELKRRRVARVAAVHAAIGFVVLEACRRSRPRFQRLAGQRELR